MAASREQSWKCVVSVVILLCVARVHHSRSVYEWYPCAGHSELATAIQNNPVMGSIHKDWEVWYEWRVHAKAIDTIHPIACRLFTAGCSLAKLYTHHAHAKVSFLTTPNKIDIRVGIGNRTATLAAVDCKTSTVTWQKTLQPANSETPLYHASYSHAGIVPVLVFLVVEAGLSLF